MNALDAWTVAARRAVPGLTPDWHGFFYEKVGDQGVMVTGLVVTRRYVRGPRKGELNFGKGDLTTKRRVFVSHAAFARAKADHP